MTSIASIITLSPRDFDAVLFDLDGILAQTASVHAAAWKKLFYGFLQQRSASTGEALVAFDMDADYRRYVDGKPRYDGGRVSPSAPNSTAWGTRKDGSGVQTVYGLGNLKDQHFTEKLERHGVQVYAGNRSGTHASRARDQYRRRFLEQ